MRDIIPNHRTIKLYCSSYEECRLQISLKTCLSKFEFRYLNFEQNISVSKTLEARVCCTDRREAMCSSDENSLWVALTRCWKISRESQSFRIKNDGPKIKWRQSKNCPNIFESKSRQRYWSIIKTSRDASDRRTYCNTGTLPVTYPSLFPCHPILIILQLLF